MARTLTRSEQVKWGTDLITRVLPDCSPLTAAYLVRQILDAPAIIVTDREDR